MRGIWFLILLVWAPLAAAQATMLKCRDARGQITYSNVPCDKQGLQEIGPVADRTTVMPLGPAPKPSAAKEAPKDGGASQKKDDPEGVKPGAAAQIKPVVPALEKLVK
jgi:hypothetical protein